MLPDKIEDILISAAKLSITLLDKYMHVDDDMINAFYLGLLPSYDIDRASWEFINYTDDVKYLGDIDPDKHIPHGEGMLYMKLSSVTTILGTFKNGLPDGHCSINMFSADRHIHITGIFENGLPCYKINTYIKKGLTSSIYIHSYTNINTPDCSMIPFITGIDGCVVYNYHRIRVGAGNYYINGKAVCFTDEYMYDDRKYCIYWMMLNNRARVIRIECSRGHVNYGMNGEIVSYKNYTDDVIQINYASKMYEIPRSLKNGKRTYKRRGVNIEVEYKDDEIISGVCTNYKNGVMRRYTLNSCEYLEMSLLGPETKKSDTPFSATQFEELIDKGHPVP
jgi:hypothetical protein